MKTSLVLECHCGVSRSHLADDCLSKFPQPDNNSIASGRGDLPLAAEFCYVTMALIVHPNRHVRISVSILTQFVLTQTSCLLTLLIQGIRNVSH